MLEDRESRRVGCALQRVADHAIGCNDRNEGAVDRRAARVGDGHHDRPLAEQPDVGRSRGALCRQRATGYADPSGRRIVYTHVISAKRQDREQVGPVLVGENGQAMHAHARAGHERAVEARHRALERPVGGERNRPIHDLILERDVAAGNAGPAGHRIPRLDREVADEHLVESERAVHIGVDLDGGRSAEHAAALQPDNRIRNRLAASVHHDTRDGAAAEEHHWHVALVPAGRDVDRRAAPVAGHIARHQRIRAHGDKRELEAAEAGCEHGRQQRAGVGACKEIDSCAVHRRGRTVSSDHRAADGARRDQGHVDLRVPVGAVHGRGAVAAQARRRIERAHHNAGARNAFHEELTVRIGDRDIDHAAALDGHLHGGRRNEVGVEHHASNDAAAHRHGHAAAGHALNDRVDKGGPAGYAGD